MKFLFLVITLIAGSILADSQYICQSLDGTVATLSIQDNNIVWLDETHSVGSLGLYRGVEEAPFSTELGYLVYLATDYEMTEDSAWYIKLDPNFESQSGFRVLEVFDNDGHNEFETEFKCE